MMYSPSGKQVLIGTDPDGFSMDGAKLEVCGADLAEFKTVVPSVASPMSMQGQAGKLFPGWVDEKTVYYFSSAKVYGTATTNVMLCKVGIDGKGGACLQPQIDTAAMKEAK
jgi:hypothetical protein